MTILHRSAFTPEGSRWRVQTEHGLFLWAGPLPAGFEFRATYDPDDQFLTTLERA